MKLRRSYTMGVRAQSAADTRQKIVVAGRDLLIERAGEPITLGDIATRADVSVPTVLRAFQSKDGALDAARELLLSEMRTPRPVPPPGDIPAAVSILYANYEAWGDFTMRVLAAEYAHPELGDAIEDGRQWHRKWVEETFRPQLTGRQSKSRRMLVDILVVATDVYTWKLLRRDMQLSQAESEARAEQMITALLEAK